MTLASGPSASFAAISSSPAGALSIRADSLDDFEWLDFAVIPGCAALGDNERDHGHGPDAGRATAHDASVRSEPILCLPWRAGRVPVQQVLLQDGLVTWLCHDGTCEGIDLTPVLNSTELQRRLIEPQGLLTMEVTEGEGAVGQFALRCTHSSITPNRS